MSAPSGPQHEQKPLEQAREPEKRSTQGGSHAQVQLKGLLQGRTYAEQAAALAPPGPFVMHQSSQDMVQAKGHMEESAGVHAAAAHGVQGGGSTLPHVESIQSAFGKHDVSRVSAHVGGKAKEASRAMGASAYASGNDVAFANQPDLHTAAHEAAHIVQQRAGVSLKGGVGQVGDSYEVHADKVADAVVAGKSAEPILDEMAGESSGGALQQKAIQRDAYKKPKANEDEGYHKDTSGVGEENYQAIDAKSVDPEATLTSPQFIAFAARIKTLLTGIGSTDDPMVLAEATWLEVIRALAATEAVMDDKDEVPLVEGSTYQKQMSVKGYQNLLPRFDALGSKILSSFSQAHIDDAKSWGFWSGKGAQNAAKNNCDSSLEGGYIGYAFDSINITGDWDMQLWGGLSRAYARAAVSKLEGRSFHVFVGAGEHTSENIWAQVESKVVYEKARRTPGMKINVHAVIHPEATGIPEAGGQQGCMWSAPGLKHVAVEPMRKVARDKANKTTPPKKD